ncbi:MAG: SBBP repeat-containing protein [Bacteroidales bacterium]
MKLRFYFILFFLFSGISSYSQVWEWAKQIGGDDHDIGRGITIDSKGNAYAMGDFFGVAIADSVKLKSYGDWDVVFVKYDSLGKIKWVKNAGGAMLDKGNCICVDKKDNVFITGCFFNVATFEPLKFIAPVNRSAFLVKINPKNGKALWAAQVNGTYYQEGTSLTFDNSGNIYVAGNFYDTAYFNRKKITCDSVYNTTDTLTSKGKSDIFIAKYDSLGMLIWVKRFGGAKNDECNSIACDRNNDIFFTGTFENLSYFDNTLLNSNGKQDVFIAKLDKSGNVLWAKQSGGGDEDVAKGIAIDTNSNVFVTGYFSGIALFGTKLLTSRGRADIFLSKYDSIGNLQWTKQAGAEGWDKANAITMDDSGNVYIAGSYSGKAIFDSTKIASKTNSIDVYIAKYNSVTGDFKYVIDAGGKGIDEANGIKICKNENIYVTGSFGAFGSMASFGKTTLRTTFGTNDIFIAKYVLSSKQQK